MTQEKIDESNAALNMCPVCGYGMKFPASDFHICPCCGTEFGYDDAVLSHAELREEWIGAGSKWFSDYTHPPTHPPTNTD